MHALQDRDLVPGDNLDGLVQAATELKNGGAEMPRFFYRSAAVRYLSPDGERQPAGGQRAAWQSLPYSETLPV